MKLAGLIIGETPSLYGNFRTDQKDFDELIINVVGIYDKVVNSINNRSAAVTIDLVL
jgi:hypothetical protein